MSALQRNYFDHNATTPLRAVAKEAMIQAMDDLSANPSSIHTSGRQARLAIDLARESIADLAGLPSREIVFTSGGTESDNLALFAMAQKSDEIGEAIVSQIEHSAVKDSALKLEEMGWTIHWLAPDQNGFHSVESFKSLITDKTKWTSLHWANNEIGLVQPVVEMSKLCRAQNILFHSDAVQALGRLEIDFSEFEGDLISFSSHKIGGPKGVGALWVKDAEAIPQRQFGGSQEREIRPGTENLYGIISFGAAAKECQTQLKKEIEEVQSLRDSFEKQLKAELSEIKIHGESLERLPNTSSILMPNKTSDLMLMALDIKGYDVSAGSACSSGSVSYSPVIKAMGYSEQESASTLRVSFGRGNTQEQVDQFVKDLVAVYKI